jgi:preprotein translocase subunit SecG
MKEFSMLALLAFLHVMIGLALILFVLLQDPKGGAMGVFSGGSSANTFFGSSGASNFLTTTTKWLAVMFAVSCLTLTYMTAKRGGSVMDNYTPAAATPPTTAPGTPPVVPPAPGQEIAPQAAPPATTAPAAPPAAPSTPDKAKH